VYCRNPGCRCHEVQLTFTQIDHPEGHRSPGQSFRIRVDLDTWQECDPPRREPQLKSWVQEFLAEYPDARKAEFRAHYEAGKQVAQRIAEYALDSQAVLTGELVSYTEILTGEGALSSGGRSYSHCFIHQGREYFVEDLYCPNPSCDCQELHVQFWERARSATGKDVIIVSSFLGKVTFGGRLEIDRTGKRKRGESLSILSAWWQEHEHDLDMFQQRYRSVKKIGQRSIDAIEKQSPQKTFSRRPGVDPLAQLEPMARSSPTSNQRIGRNDPCLCGSGKKFKRCCGTHLRNSQLSAR
jgi:hypothetical protein